MLLRGFDLIWSGELSLWNPLLVVELNIAVAYSLIFLKV